MDTNICKFFGVLISLCRIPTDEQPLITQAPSNNQFLVHNPNFYSLGSNILPQNDLNYTKESSKMFDDLNPVQNRINLSLNG